MIAPLPATETPPRRTGRGRSLVVVLMIAVAAAMIVAFMLEDRSHGNPAPIFEDVTLTSGLAGYAGITYGAAWGDFDGDGLPDLYVTNHLNGAQLFRNLGNGRFADVTGQWFAPADLLGDKHGAAWADFDNDGRLDLVQLTGADRGVGSEAKRLFLNRGTRFEDVAESAGVANAFGRTRMPLWIELGHTGQLDLFQGAERRFDDRSPPFFFVQRDGKFNPSDQIATFASRSVPFCILTQLSASASNDLVCRIYGEHKAAQVFDTATLPMQEREVLPPTAFEDIAAGDFNNDGWIDLFLARKNQAPAVAIARPAVNELVADAMIDQHSVEKSLGFTFRSKGQVKFRVDPAFPADLLSPDKIHIGAGNIHPPALQFQLSPDVKGATGAMPFAPGRQAGVYISLTPPDQWQVMISGTRESLDGKGRFQQIAVKATSSEAITDTAVVGGAPSLEEAPARLFINHAGRLVEEGDKWGINDRLVSAVNVVAGDFDNDMHLDLFVVVSGDVGKQENLLLLNRGNGRFEVIPHAGGAAGDRAGVGDSVTVVDYDGDGFLDLLVATGGSMGRSLGLPSESGSYHLYHNRGNGNHWLEIDLEGTKSNRDGIGARVQVTAGGITQVRIQDGGIHNHGQNHSRLHFGLAKYVTADKITIRWPSGTSQELTNVGANQIVRIREP